MKAVIFAGGVGKRIWPLSRSKFPKQLQAFVGKKSLLEQAVERLAISTGYKDIFLVIPQRYVSYVRRLIPKLPKGNIMAEPVGRDVGPAIAFFLTRAMKEFPDEPVAILWTDHYIKYGKKFCNALETASKFIVERKKDCVVNFGVPIAFPTTSLGYIQAGRKVDSKQGVVFKRFKSFKYQPSQKQLSFYLKNKNKYFWNTGYSIVRPRFLWSLFEKYAPKVCRDMTRAVEAKSAGDFKKLYAKVQKIHMDHAIWERMSPGESFVMIADVHWRDVGTWDQLKSVLLEGQKAKVVSEGLVVDEASENVLVYNQNNKEKVVVTVGLKDLIVVDTPDALLVCQGREMKGLKKAVNKVKKIKGGRFV